MTKQPPFKADSIRKLKDKLNKPFTLKFPDRYSGELRAMCEGLLQVDPARRISFASFFEHPLFMSWPDASSHVPYGDAPPTPSPSGSMVQGSASVESGGPVDDRSYILIDKAQVELGKLVDDLDQPQPEDSPIYRISSWSPTQPRRPKGSGELNIVEKLKNITVQVNDVERPASAIMAVASALRRGVGQSPGAHAAFTDLPFKERVELLLLYHMAQSTLHDGFVGLRPGLSNLREFRSAKRSEAIQRLRQKYDECLAWIEELRCQLPPELASGDAAASARLQEHGIRPPEELIYIHAMYLCREAAAAETTHHDLGTSEVLYDRALTLFKLLRKEAPLDDAHILDEFIGSTKRRLSQVVSLAKAASGVRRVAAESGANAHADVERDGHGHTRRTQMENEYLAAQDRGRSSSFTDRQRPKVAGMRERSSSLKNARNRRMTPPDRHATPPERRMTPPDRRATPPERRATPPDWRGSTPPDHHQYANHRHPTHAGHRHGTAVPAPIQPRHVPATHPQQSHHHAGSPHTHAHTPPSPHSQYYADYSPPTHISQHQAYAHASPPLMHQVPNPGVSPPYQNPAYHDYGQVASSPPPFQQHQQPHQQRPRQQSPHQMYQHVLPPAPHGHGNHQDSANSFRGPYSQPSPPMTAGMPMGSGSHTPSHSYHHGDASQGHGTGFAPIPPLSSSQYSPKEGSAAPMSASKSRRETVWHDPSIHGPDSSAGHPPDPQSHYGSVVASVGASSLAHGNSSVQHQMHPNPVFPMSAQVGRGLPLQLLDISLPFGGDSYHSHPDDLAMSASVVREKAQNTEAEVERLKEQVKQLQMLVSSSPPACAGAIPLRRQSSEPPYTTRSEADARLEDADLNAEGEQFVQENAIAEAVARHELDAQ